jgi:predicted nucleotidyltransferase
MRSYGPTQGSIVATCTTRFSRLRCRLPNASVRAWDVSEFVLTPAERTFLKHLDALGVRYLIIGMAAAIMEGAPGTTVDLDVWFETPFPDPYKVQQAARLAGGFYLSGIGSVAPRVGGESLRRVDVVSTAQGLAAFDEEYARAQRYRLDDMEVRVLPLERVAHSKRTANRAKDRAQLPAIEAALAARQTRSLDAGAMKRVVDLLYPDDAPGRKPPKRSR